MPKSRHVPKNTPGIASLPTGRRTAGHKPTNLETTDPTLPRGWHSRGYLPHFDGTATQHVTLHLADSLPKAALERIVNEIEVLPEEQRDIEKRKRVDAWIDAGHGWCILREPEIARMVQNALLHFDAQRCRLFAWVIMPNHAHVLFQPIDPWSMADIVASWKKYTARGISDWRNTWERQSPDWPSWSTPIWHREYWDRYMRDEYHFQKTIRYIHQNPVKAHLAATPEVWPWSSAFPGNTPPGSASPGIATLPSGRRTAGDKLTNPETDNPQKTK